MNTTQNDVTNALTTAMQTIAESNVQSKEATLTIEAEIVDVVDEGLGIYIVKYLGNKFEATTAHSEVTYEVGDMVYVIVPNGNFDRKKIILSPINTSSAVYTTTEENSIYVPIGENLFSQINDISLCSWYPERRWVSIDEDSNFRNMFSSSFKDTHTFNLTCKIKTDIEKLKGRKCNYGLELNIPIYNDNYEYIQTYQVIIDINNIIGDPYNLEVPALQNIYFTLPDDLKAYEYMSSPWMYAFVETDTYDNTKPCDIFISNIQLIPVLEINKETFSGYHAILTASEGNSFLRGRTQDTKTLYVTPYLNGKVTKVNNFDCYWFKENVAINNNSEKYQRFGGLGWEILNKVSEKNIDSDGKVTYQYITNMYTYTISQADIHTDTRFKCVLVKEDKAINPISSIVTIKNLESYATVKLTSVTGSTIFSSGTNSIVKLKLEYYDPGITTVQRPEYIIGYDWQRLDNKGNYIDNDFYTIEEFNVKDYDRIYTIISFPANKIKEANIIGCTVYIRSASENQDFVKTQIVGTDWITISIGESTGGYISVINGDKLYKYDSDGDSPMVADYDGPLSSAIKTIDPIIIQLYKEEGNEFTEDEYAATTITWYVPVNSMIKVDFSNITYRNGIKYYYKYNDYNWGGSTLNYSIDNTYNKNKMDNTIIIEAKAPSTILKNTILNTANIRFLKDGEGGTNGSKYSAIITYNNYGYEEKDTNGKIHKLKLVYFENTKKWYGYDNATKEFIEPEEESSGYSILPWDKVDIEVNIYKDGIKYYPSPYIDDNWSIFDYEHNQGDLISPIHLVGNSIYIDNIEWENPQWNWGYGAVLQADVKLHNSNSDREEHIIAYYPIECIYIPSYFSINSEYIKKFLPSLDNGFYKVLYASDGTNPQYDNSNDFYFNDTMDDVNYIYWFNYNWNCSGSNLHNENLSLKEKTHKFTPATKYEDGIAKNWISVYNTKKSNADSSINFFIELDNESMTYNTDYLNYYQILEDNISILSSFYYDGYLSILNQDNAKEFYLVKTNLIKISEQLLNQINKIIDLCNEYKEKEDGSIDSNIIIIYNEALEKLEKINNLINLCVQLGLSLSILWQIIDEMTIEILQLENKIPYINNIPERDCYFTINDNIDLYNNIINTLYSTYVNLLSNSEVINGSNIITQLIQNLENFVNDNRFEKLTETYHGVEYDIDEEAYKYDALLSVLKSCIKSIYTQTDISSCNSVIEKVLKPIRDSITPYSTLSYANKITEFNDSIDIITEDLNILNEILSFSAEELLFKCVKPIIMVYNTYEFNNINGWDGNKLELGDGYLIAPQIGSGIKNIYNQFTGIVMGIKHISETTSPYYISQQVGLFGYSSGVQSLFLNAQDGSAIFGKSGSGQIIIDPSQSKALLYSSDFWQNSNYGSDGKPKNYSKKSDGSYYYQQEEGMLIDLSTPEIRFGNGNFIVSSDGHITAKGGGEIAGWKINNTQIYKGEYDYSKIVLDSENKSIYTNNHSTFYSENKGFCLISSTANNTHGGLSMGSKVYIRDDGLVRLGNGAITGTGRHWTITTNGTDENINSYIAYGTTVWTEADSSTSETNTVYLGTDGLTIGRRFSIDKMGQLKAWSGDIGGWNITSNRIYSGNIELAKNGSIKHTGNNWSINQDGSAVFTNITATGTINALGGYLGLSTKNPITNQGLKFNQGSIEFGAATPDKDNSGIKCDSAGNVKISGDIYARNGYFSGEIQSNSGKIGGWDISTAGLVNNNSTSLYLKHDGSIGADTITSTSLSTTGDIHCAGNLIVSGGSGRNVNILTAIDNCPTAGTKTGTCTVTIGGVDYDGTCRIDI